VLAKKSASNNKKLNQGSADHSAEPSFLVIGQIQKPHGVRGEVRVVTHTDYPERFNRLETVYVGEDDPQPMEVESARFHGDLVLLKLAGYDSREEAAELRGEWLLVPESEAVPLEEGEYYLYQLEGLQVFTDDGEELGELMEVIETGANNVFVVRGDTGDLLLPDTDEVVVEIDFENGRMTVHLLPGLRN
jgi:16S rRNA processing protein RimM